MDSSSKPANQWKSVGNSRTCKNFKNLEVQSFERGESSEKKPKLESNTARTSDSDSTGSSSPGDAKKINVC